MYDRKEFLRFLMWAESTGQIACPSLDFDIHDQILDAYQDYIGISLEAE